MLWYIGLDVHQRTSSICILDGNGKVVKEIRIKGSWREVVAVLRGLGHPFVVCYEASCGYGHLYDHLSPIAQRVVVAHPGQLRLIFKSKRKNDRVDARKLAKLLLLDLIPAVHVPSVDVRSWRNMVEFRSRLIAKRTRVKNSLRSLMRGHGVELPGRQGLWTVKGRLLLAETQTPTTSAALQRDMLLDELRHQEAQIQRVTCELDKIGHNHPGVCLLRTAPGVGPRTSEAVVAYIDVPERFRRSKQVGSYFGLVPCQDSSAQVNRLGHITREGPATVRRLLTEAAWQGIRRSPHLRSFFERVRGGDPDRRKIALVATTNYLVRVLYAMLRTGEVWRHDQDPKATG